jgi:hypothetical protein
MERTEQIVANDQLGLIANPVGTEAYASGVSWAAVIAGAFVAAALSLILLALGTGMGLASVSPWSNVGASAPTIHRASIVWLILVQIIASAMGGYLAGRLRTKWATIHTDEVYFRDTAHGFLVWAVGLVITASFLVPAAASLMGSVAQEPGPLGSGVNSTTESQTSDPSDYYIDALFRADDLNTDRFNAPARAEAKRIFIHALMRGHLPAVDETYLGKLLNAKTGLPEPEAEERVSLVFAEIQSAAETARKAVAHLCLWIFLALLIGAFCASYAATIGGRERDHVKLI